MNQKGFGQTTLNVLGKGAKATRNFFGPTQNNNANRARQNALKQAIAEYAKVFNGANHLAYIKAARKLNSVLAEPPKNNREYKNGLAVLRVTPGTTAANIRRKINERLNLNRRKFLNTALLNTSVSHQNIKNVFGSNTNLSYRIFANRFNSNLVKANTLNKLRNLEASIPAGHPSATNYRNRIEKKRANVSSKAPNVQPPPPPNVKPSPNNGAKNKTNNGSKNVKGNNGAKNKTNRGTSSGGATASAVGIGSQIIQIGSGNSSNLRKRLENLERARNASERAKTTAKNANVRANANPGNANAARRNANAARAALEAMRIEFEAVKAAAAAAEAEKVKLQARVTAAEASGSANVNSLRAQLLNAKAAAERIRNEFTASITEVRAEAEKARANANATRANAENKKKRAESAEATAAEHLAAKQAAETAANAARESAEKARIEKDGAYADLATALTQIAGLKRTKQANSTERNAAAARLAHAQAAAAAATEAASRANAARLAANARANAASRNANAKVEAIQKQLANATKQAERNAAKIATLTAQGANTSALNAARANAARHAAEENRLRRQLASVSTGKVVNVAKGVVYGVGGVLAAGLRGGLNLLSRAPVQTTVSLQRGNANNNAFKRRAAAEALGQIKGTVTSIPFGPNGKIIAQEGYGRSAYGPQQLLSMNGNTRQSNMYRRVATQSLNEESLLRQYHLALIEIKRRKEGGNNVSRNIPVLRQKLVRLQSSNLKTRLIRTLNNLAR